MGSSILKIDRLNPYYEIAKEYASKSTCTRKQFGAVVAYDGNDFRFVAAYNETLSDCCGGHICIRDHHNRQNGENVEEGAEVHAEVAALISSGPKVEGMHFILAGLHKGKELLDETVYPCHVCALALKYAGYRFIYLKNRLGELSPVSVARIVKFRESEWVHDV